MSQNPSGPTSKQQIINLALATAAGQVGCLTLIIVLAAVIGGLWLDAQFNTGHVLLFTLLIISLPVSLAVMFVVVRAATGRIQTQSTSKKEANLGKDS
ncbi:MAG TPA: AtpZ/AtpI family protein [Anaerolineaceae bacterium]|nr:AtpZ/AtpI family protein [Anaerolineaceae bacterium]HPN51547.1 AtpZ/AtpI family protein [Anaerolineaceae bacterium]